MVRPEEAKFLETMKAAKTVREMGSSWHGQRPGVNAPASGGGGFNLYFDQKPEMVKNYVHQPLMQIVENGIFDPKTRYLIILSCFMMAEHWGGLMAQAVNAKAHGATDEEILEVANLVCYATTFLKTVGSCTALQGVFNNPGFQEINKPEK